MRNKVIAGNWKMNKTPSESVEFVKELIPLVKDASSKVVVCVPAICIAAVKSAIENSNIKLGAQNLHFEESGAYTGEVSAAMLNDAGVEYVIIGHSERRQYFAETNETVNKKVHTALKHNLIPIVCVGESLEEREQGITEDLVRLQVKIAFKGIKKEQAENIIIAYEPIWAIGTGKTATAEDADYVNSVIRDTIKGLYDENTAENIIIQYGGSMNAGNAKELLAKPNIDGGLIGGASLKAQDFTVIVTA